MSNDYLLYYGIKFIPTLNKNNYDKYYYTLINQFLMISASTSTNLILPKITMNLSFLLNDKNKLKNIYNSFYEDINKLDNEWLDDDLKLIKPSLINMSVGV